LSVSPTKPVPNIERLSYHIAKQVDTLRKENTMLRRAYPKEADHLEEYGSRQRKSNLPTKMNDNVRNKKYIPNYHNAIEHDGSKVDPHTYKKFEPI